MSGARHWEQDKDSTLYVGNLDERCTDALVWELMLQAGPVINVHLPKDRVTQSHQGYGFVEFGSEDDADYACKIMNQIRLWGKPIRVNKASADKRSGENGGLGGGAGVGAELFVGNLDTLVDEKVLYETFSRFGPLVAAPKVARDESNLSKGYGFVSYATFESSDQAIEHMHGQYLMNKEITVQYAYKKDGKGERHGDAAERALAAQARKHGVEVAIPALPAALVMPNNTPSAPAAMNGYPVGGPVGGLPPPNGMPPRPISTPQAPPSYGGYGHQAYGAPPTPTGFGNLPQPTMTGTIPNGAALPSRQQYNQSPLQAPPPAAGLPARPPPGNGGYGGPQAAPGMQAGFQGMHPPPMGFPPANLPPPPAGFPPQQFRQAPPPSGFPPPRQ
ncbi:Spliceosome-associated protein 49 [Fulvia fulva]|uniref:Spliceosome-associated protein 49 n=1 Tax=Passalora fulva TaxID=5499 RepID=A0A9Q8PB55_PASFU|nr:Spliceosome-associated protein 49 [Fulvia fulva]KAK4622030.1 Spliceosome-associated protein 49 [Fulvia fulva]KAK4622694.1 Spliceosome-associated protein 49 [Fulvia fulva]UJO19201.1 Spliceosome-associated protein 49 [Fulvia fulva]WPV16010.1 Spliceosome-associated protein 49 [Fulvia fulva]WPV31293.1 Spliceosome-associated protein 49 [Fulvia fulva]